MHRILVHPQETRSDAGKQAIRDCRGDKFYEAIVIMNVLRSLTLSRNALRFHRMHNDRASPERKPLAGKLTARSRTPKTDGPAGMTYPQASSTFHSSFY